MRRGLFFLPVAALIGCGPPDYTPVRDWANVAGNAAIYPELVTRPGAAPVVSPAADAITAMQQALATYLQALDTLAADGLLMIREDPLAVYAPRVAPISPKGAEAITELGALLRERGRSLARAPQLRATIREADAPVQALIAAMQESVTALEPAETTARDQARARYQRLQREARDEASRQILRDLAALHEAGFANRAAAISNYRTVLTDIAKGHALLKERVSHLTQEETARQIRAAEAELRRAGARLPRDGLGIAVPVMAAPR
ncbi:MAG: hypothetical protein ING10_05750 [Roseomonas sp.]|nr:hypothetical protein [Roseomonas sp.]